MLLVGWIWYILMLVFGGGFVNLFVEGVCDVVMFIIFLV